MIMASRLLLNLALFVVTSAVAQDAAIPTPKVVIYPGDIIRGEMLVDDLKPIRDSGGDYIENRDLIVGKVARLTLLPGHAVPVAGIANRKLVANGREVTLIYAEGGLTILTTGSALQDGSIGDFVHVRNSDTGVTVMGAVQADGSVMVGG